jgi:chloride channel protein, CIC family
MIVSALAYFISRYFHPESIYTAPLAERGIKFRSESERYFLSQVSLRDLVERDFEVISPNMKLGEVVQRVVQTKRNLFPVVDENRKLVGIITLNDIREIMLNTDVHDVILAYEIMDANFQSVDIDVELSEIFKIFEQKQVWNIAVTKKGAYEGFISKSNFFNSYISIWSQQQKSEGI